MELKHLLSVVIAVLTALGAMLYAMGSQSPWLATALWMAAVVSLVVTDFLGVVRRAAKLAALADVGRAGDLPAAFRAAIQLGQPLADGGQHSDIFANGDLFQDKDPRVYGWLAVMSLLQAVVAARYSQGVAFGAVLIAYTIVGIMPYRCWCCIAKWGHASGPVGWALAGTSGKGGLQAAHAGGVAAMQSQFTSAPAGTGRSGVVGESFARLALSVSAHCSWRRFSSRRCPVLGFLPRQEMRENQLYSRL